MVNKPTHLSGSLIDHVYIEKSLMEEFFANATVKNIYFSDHYAVRIIIEKNAVDFVLFQKIRYYKARKNKLIGFLVFLVILIRI